MKCYFDQDGKPKVDITVIGLDNQATVVASIDTGFTGALMLSLPAALSIGLKLANVLPVELADGSIKKEFVFEGSVEVEAKRVPVEILLTTSAESLLGTALLKERRLTIDFPHGMVTITPSVVEKRREEK